MNLAERAKRASRPGRVFLVSLPILLLTAPVHGNSENMAGSGATTVLTPVRGPRLQSGGAALLTYGVEHEFLEDTAQNTPLPGAFISRDENAPAFDGFWDEMGASASWLSPKGSPWEFEPVGHVIENGFFINSVRGSGNAVPLNAGDHADIAVSQVAGNAPLSWDAPRNSTAGALVWDVAQDVQTVEASYAGDAGWMDVVTVRADVVARGGDVDTSDRPTAMPPLIIQLPRTYPEGTQIGGGLVSFFPHTGYQAGKPRMTPAPQEGKITFEAEVQGYIHEAKEYRLPSGADVAEWHIPYRLVFWVIPPDTTETGLEGSLVMHGDGTPGVAFELGPGGETLAIPAGGAVRLRSDGDAQITDSLGRVRDGQRRDEIRPSMAGGGTEGKASAAPGTNCSYPCRWSHVEEWSEASSLNHQSVEPAELTLGGKAYQLRLNPDFRGLGTWAVEALRRPLTGTPVADALAVPSVTLDGAQLRLDRSRLTDVRVFPEAPWFKAKFGSANTINGASKTTWGFARSPGVVIETVYRLREGVFAFVTFRGWAEIDATPPFVFTTEAVVMDLSGQAVDATATQYAELPSTGQVMFDGAERGSEFTAPASANKAKQLSVGNHAFTGDSVWGDFTAKETTGTLVVKAHDGEVDVSPTPDVMAPIANRRLEIYYTSRADDHVANMPWGFAPNHASSAQLIKDGKPIGQSCGDAQISDASGDSLPTYDILSAWFDADARNVQATLELAQIPGSASPKSAVGDPNITELEVHWSDANGARYARTTLDDRSRWVYDAGSIVDGGRERAAQISGESTQVGSRGFVRMWIPRELFVYEDGETLTQMTAHSWLVNGENRVELDGAPNSHLTADLLGRGGSYTVGTCA